MDTSPKTRKHHLATYQRPEHKKTSLKPIVRTRIDERRLWVPDDIEDGSRLLDPTQQYTPEQMLWAEVLLASLEDIGIVITGPFVRCIEYEDWLESSYWFKYTGSEFRTANWVMEHVGLDVDTVRRRVDTYRCPCCRRKLINNPCKARTIGLE